MSPSTKRHLNVDDVIAAIYAGSVEGGPNGNLKAQVKRVSVELGRRKAHQFTRRLLDSLAQNSEDAVQLEALVVLGFAHPDVMRKNHITLASEGRRLSKLLEKQERNDRAREVLELLCERYPDDRNLELELAGVVRRSGKTEELIERYLERAQEHFGRKELDLALPWLQQIIALDRNRKDVTRMIADIRHHQSNRRHSARSNRRFVVVFLMVGALLAGLGYREWNIHQETESIPIADRKDLNSMAARMSALQGLLGDHQLWLGRNRVMREVSELEAASQTLREEAQAAQAQEQQALEEKRTQAEYLRQEGLKAADLGDWSTAREQFQAALLAAPQDWEHRATLKKDIQAIKAMGSGQ